MILRSFFLRFQRKNTSCFLSKEKSLTKLSLLDNFAKLIETILSEKKEKDT